jgi:RND superfamily putative drug exporter
MSRLLYRLGRLAARHPWRIIGAWITVALVAVALDATIGGQTKDDLRVPGTESRRAVDLLEAKFPSRGGSSGQVVFAARHGRITDATNRKAVTATLEAIGRSPNVMAVTDPFDPMAPAVNDRRTTAYSVVSYDVDHIGPQQADEALRAVKIARAAGLDAELSRSIVDSVEHADSNEAIGLLVAAIVLLIAFGSVIAAGIPIGTAMFGIFIGVTLIGVMSGLTDVPSVSLMLATMIGLGVGIDYALFVVTRHRGFLHDGHSPTEAAGLANATSGSAVLFAGGTVVIALAGLRVAGIPAIATMGLASAVTVAVAGAAAVTLLPALLGLAGHHIDRLRVGRRRHIQRARAVDQPFAARWARTVCHRPWRFLLASLAVLLILAAPVLSMRTGVADDGNADRSLTYRKAYDLLAAGFGPGFTGPLTIVVRSPHLHRDAAAVHDALGHARGIALVSAPAVNPAGDTAVITAIPTTSPQDAATTRLVHRLRDDLIPGVLHGTRAQGYVTGRTAASIDISDRLGSRLPLFIATVIGLSFLLLMLVFRSVVVPLKAAVMNVLSIGAAYGAVVAVFQWGWGRGLVGLEESVPISPFLPMIMFAVLFGLSMDYEVFLLSRIREEFVKTGDSRQSVVDGLAGTAKVITSAALIMISVFASFLLIDDLEIKMFAVGLTVAVLVDATIVRMMLVPATMELMGDSNWWLPRWLDRILPHMDLEGGQHLLAASVPADAQEAAEASEGEADADGGGDDVDPAVERELEPVG